MKLIEIEKKSRILTRAGFGCLRDAYTLNITRGCEFMCVYCYARGYPEAPLAGEVYLYHNLAEKLAAELDNPRRRSVIKWVVFNTASDSFQSHPRILDITFRTMEVLLQRGIGFSFLTKGRIPCRFIELFSNHPDLIVARIGLVSTRSRYRDIFEPHAATIDERLRNIDRLKEIGVNVEVRVDPIIPFYTDDAVTIKQLFGELARRDVHTVSLSYLHLRPAIFVQLKQELPPTEFQVIQTCFQAQSWSVVGSASRSKLIPFSLRKRGYRRFVDLAKDYQIAPYICSCKNPDMPANQCSTGRGPQDEKKSKIDRAEQLSLFSCSL